MANPPAAQEPFNFMGLPKDARLIIYEYVFAPIKTKTIRVFDPEEGPATEDGQILPLRSITIPCANCSLIGPTTLATMTQHTTCMPMLRMPPSSPHRLLYRCSGRLHPALLLVNRTIYTEALPFLYQSMNLEIHISQSLGPNNIISAILSRFSAPLSPPARASVRTVRITLDIQFCVPRDVADMCRTLNAIFPRLRRIRVNIVTDDAAALQTIGNPLLLPLPRRFMACVKPLLVLNRAHDVQFVMQVLRHGNRCERLQDVGLAVLLDRDEVQTGLLGLCFRKEMRKQRVRRGRKGKHGKSDGFGGFLSRA